jgi:TolB protein
VIRLCCVHLSVCCVLLCGRTAGADTSDFEVSGATISAYPIALAVLPTKTAANQLEALRTSLGRKLDITAMFKVLDPHAFLAKADEGDDVKSINFQAWRDVAARGLVKLRIDVSTVTYSLFDAGLGKPIDRATFAFTSGQAEALSGPIADRIIEKLSGEPGPFNSRLVFVRKEGRDKSLWVAEPDGTRARRITKRGTLNILPTWDHQGRAVYFTSYARGTPDLYRVLPTGGRWTAVSRREGLNTGAAVSPSSVTVGGKTYARLIALSLSKDGNSEIYLLDEGGRIVKRLTNHWGIDTSPSWSPDSRRIAYVSNRGGSPQIYTVSVASGARQRLTFQGNYNQTPAWSPKGDLVAFTGRDERNVFDVFTVNVNTLKIRRLTQDQGHNEEPSWAPNGRLIAFTSTRGGSSPRIWIMREDGRNARLLNKAMGAAITPRWSPFLPARK